MNKAIKKEFYDKMAKTLSKVFGEVECINRVSSEWLCDRREPSKRLRLEIRKKYYIISFDLRKEHPKFRTTWFTVKYDVKKKHWRLSHISSNIYKDFTEAFDPAMEQISHELNEIINEWENNE